MSSGSDPSRFSASGLVSVYFIFGCPALAHGSMALSGSCLFYTLPCVEFGTPLTSITGA